MRIKNHTWLTIKYKEDSFDVKLPDEGNVIGEIRPIDSETNIVAILDKKIIYAMQETVDAEMNHKQYMQYKKFIEEPIMQYKELRQINVSQHIEKKNGLSYLSWSWAVDQLLQLDACGVGVVNSTLHHEHAILAFLFLGLHLSFTRLTKTKKITY